MSKYDIIFVLPYLYSDHPSFPEGILKHHLESHQFKVGVIQTPFWQKPESFTPLGKPRLFFAIIPGPVDSVVLNYTSTRKRRNEDLYQREGQAFFPGHPPSIKYKIRPDRCVVVFANRIRQVFKDTPLLIGGVEASQRRFAHYDFQADKLKRSILLDSRADLMVTGMGERQILQIAQQAAEGTALNEIDLPGTARITKDVSIYNNYITLPTMEEISGNASKLVEAAQKIQSAAAQGKGIIQQQDNRYVVEHPASAYSPADLDTVYDYPYTRQHLDGKVVSPALQMNLFSITSHRGCGGGCAFCSISMHEGKRIVSRSEESIFREIHHLRKHPQWKGVISDIGGATAELYDTNCHNKKCPKISCLFPNQCKSLRSTDPYLQLLRRARQTQGVKKIFLGSGVRYDLLLQNPELLEEILDFHSGRFLRVAPEHTEPHVLKLMHKPPFERFEEFVKLFQKINRNLKRKIELAPYLIIGHPGEHNRDAAAMKKKLRSLGVGTTDVQIFTPSPGTLSTAMYYAGQTPQGESLSVEKDIKALVRRKNILAGK